MSTIHHWHLRIAVLLACLLPFLSACTTTRTAVSYDTQFQPGEGLVTLRMVDVSNVLIRTFTVISETTGEEFALRDEKFGQTSSTFFVGRLPAGRYQPKELHASTIDETGFVHRTIPLGKSTGKFEVEAQRITDLGTMVFLEIDGSRRKAGAAGKWNFTFALPLDPTPVPTDHLLAARFPELAKAKPRRSGLGWLPWTIPDQPAGATDFSRRGVKAVRQPVFIGDNTLLAGGSLGIVTRYAPGAYPRLFKIDTVHAVESVLVLKDGRWLAGGEEGLLAVSSDAGATWLRLPGLDPEEVVIHLSQAKDGRLFMVTDRDHEAVVYESTANPLAWKVIRRLPSDRRQGLMTQGFGEAARHLPDFAVASPDRLVVFTRENRLHSLDLSSGQWESHETPRNFNHGIKVTPDGYVIGIFSSAWVYGSLDYGKTWNRLEAWANMSQPHFFDRNRGVMMASDVLSVRRFKLRSTQDGGKTWTTGDEVGSGWWERPLWSNPAGSILFTTTPQREILRSTDQGKSWF